MKFWRSLPETNPDPDPVELLEPEEEEIEPEDPELMGKPEPVICCDVYCGPIICDPDEEDDVVL